MGFMLIDTYHLLCPIYAICLYYLYISSLSYKGKRSMKKGEKMGGKYFGSKVELSIKINHGAKEGK